MRTTLVAMVICTIAAPSQIQAQAPVELKAGLGYARMFDAGGVSFAANVDRLLTPGARLQHAVGGSFWYAHTGIASRANDPYGRHVLGLGVRYQLALGSAESFRPFVAVPVRILRSSIPDRTDLLPASFRFGVPEPPPPTPVEDLVGSEWGWGSGLEVGFAVGLGGRLRGQTSVELLYQDIYRGESSNGAWTWHAGLSYALFDR
jgi:hypothetical protein